MNDNLFWVLFFFGALAGLTAIICSNVRKECDGYGKEKETENVLTEVDMAKITTAVRSAVALEKGKVQVNIAQAMDLVEALNRVLGGKLYTLIRSIPESEIKHAKG